jgi:hypothetical protein
VRQRSGGFSGPVTATVFGKAEYQWHPDVRGGTADPDGPAKQTTLEAGPTTVYTLPKASVTVLRGKIGMAGS